MRQSAILTCKYSRERNESSGILAQLVNQAEQALRGLTADHRVGMKNPSLASHSLADRWRQWSGLLQTPRDG